jgi:hypothetical protein
MGREDNSSDRETSRKAARTVRNAEGTYRRDRWVVRVRDDLGRAQQLRDDVRKCVPSRVHEDVGRQLTQCLKGDGHRTYALAQNG